MPYFMGEKYQYCVKLLEGEDNGLRQYVWASSSEIRNAMRGVYSKTHMFIDRKIIYSDNKVTMGFDEGKMGSLEIIAENEESANKHAKRFNLPQPFVKHRGKYILNRD